MIDDAVPFFTIAEIAGVFVGFGALIGVARRSEIDPYQLGQIRTVVTNGLLVVVTALIPVGLGAYHVTGHTLWFVSGLTYSLLNWVVIYLALRRPENRRLVAAQARTAPVMAALFWLLEIPIQVPLLLVMLGVNKSLDSAFYMTALVFHLFEAAFVLAQLVYTQDGKP
ncbi:MAG: hypothetical protein JSV66_09845 [Trueperaceae bacterium]|nr:MAG: hypothetical protein JSV66_09845 [Trueperaceae bacterium]